MTSAQLITVLNVAALAAIMLSMGLQVRPGEVLASLRHTRLVILCMIANYVLVPAVAMTLLHLLQANAMVSIGFMILAVCPGAPVSPPLASLARGDLPVAIGMMALLAASSAVLTPALLALLLAKVSPNSEVTVDYLAILRLLLVVQLLPLAAGLATHHWTPAFTSRIARPTTRLGNVLLLLLIVAVVVAQYETLAEIRLRGWLGMSLLLLVSLVIGWFCGGSNPATRKALAVTTGPRNAAVGLAIATGNFAGTAAVTAVAAYGLFSAIGTLAAALLLGRVGEGAENQTAPSA